MAATGQSLSAYDRWSRNFFPVSMEGCVLYLPFWQEDMQGSAMRSYDQFHSVGSVEGAVWVANGRDFDGTDDTVSFADNDRFHFGSDFSIIIWFKADSWVGNWYEWSMLGQNDTPQTTPKWFFTYDGTQTRFEYHTGIVLVTVLGTAWTANTGTYYQIGIKRVGSTWTFYKDGATNGTATDATALVNSPNTLLVGRGQGGVDSFDGVIREVTIFKDKGLSDAEFQQNFIATKWG